jgi:hypothetical protein
MADDYTFDPHALNPWLAGLTAGAVAAIAGTLLAFTLRSPDEIVANSLTVAVGALLIGVASGWLWRRVRATDNGLSTYRWAVLGAFVVSIVAIAIVDQLALGRLISYASPLSVLIFGVVGLLTPFFATVHWPAWVTVIPVVIALALGAGLFGRGNVDSGDLSLSDLTTTTAAPTSQTTTTAAPTSETATSTAAATEAFTHFIITEGVATWTVPESLRGFSATAVGRSNDLTGSITVGEGFEFTVDLITFRSNEGRRDSFVRDMFESDPLATFTATSFELPEAADGEVVTLLVPGTLTVNGTPRQVVWEVEARKDGNVISVTGELDITLTEFGLTPPRLAFVQVEDEAHLEVLFQAEAS